MDKETIEAVVDLLRAAMTTSLDARNKFTALETAMKTRDYDLYELYQYHLDDIRKRDIPSTHLSQTLERLATLLQK